MEERRRADGEVARGGHAVLEDAVDVHREGKRRRFENLNRQVRAVVLLAAVHHVETTRVEGEARSYICLLSRTSKKRA